MTDKIRCLTVTLDQDMYFGELEPIIEAIRMIRGVEGVRLGNPVNIEELLSRDIARREIRDKIIALLYPGKKEA